ncbi:MAG: hypothetical protein ACYS18_12275 [Planctomycetota bacterium]
MKTGAINAKFAKLTNVHKTKGYGQWQNWTYINHTREVTGSKPVSPIKQLQMEAYPAMLTNFTAKLVARLQQLT